MSTDKDTIKYILEKLRNGPRFTTRAMFGEYALYADGKVVALVCDDVLYVKICPASNILEKECEKDSPYPKARPYYVISEEQLNNLTQLPQILLEMAKSLPQKKLKLSGNKSLR
jgi:TfoX/Sxy family transcriptional regulator of competence genes